MGGNSASQWARVNSSHLIAAGVAILVAGAAAFVGLQARTAAGELAARRVAWEQVASQLATVQQQFRIPTSMESASLLAEASRMGALGVPVGEKLAIIDLVGNLAEASSLASVRVTAMAATDSAAFVERQVGGTRIGRADYALSVEFVGSFANAQKFVSSLPPSVSLARMSASRREGGAQYHLVLSVYQLDAQSGD